MPRLIGLTGGIASGKSTVARCLRELGATIIDADELAREAVAPGSPGAGEIRDFFGDEIFNGDGSIDRQKLAGIVFSNQDARAKLEQITHPKIAALAAKRAAEYADHGISPVVYEAALIVENGLEKTFDGLIVVSTSEEDQLRRLIRRDGLTEHDARARIDAQSPMASKLAAATWVIDNSGSLEQTKKQVSRVWKTVLEQE